VFVYNITRPKIKFPNPLPGFPRVKNSEYYKFQGVVEEVVKGKVTKSFYEDTSHVWDDNIYPYRFQFEIESIEKEKDFLIDVLGDDFIRKTLASFHLKGDVVKLEEEAFDSITENSIILKANSVAMSSSEGKAIYKIIKDIVRDPKISKLKKEIHKTKYGKFFCEACGFSFADFYGEEFDYIECHHITPLSETGETKTDLEDLILLCANCHRVVHQSSKDMSIDMLRELVTKSPYSIQKNK
uniref:HNH endonuclease n=2 Tax=Klebsiella TaxID=570 RepID=UPI001BD1CE11